MSETWIVGSRRFRGWCVTKWNARLGHTLNKGLSLERCGVERVFWFLFDFARGTSSFAETEYDCGDDESDEDYASDCTAYDGTKYRLF